MRPADLGLPSKFIEFRKYPGFDQFRTALELATAEERFLILNGPTGSGKSLTYATVAALRKARWLVLVGTKGLQSQLLGDALVKRLVYGHRNYPCASRIAMIGIDTPEAADDPEFKCAVPRDRCGYLADVVQAREADSVVANYAYWMSIARYSDPDLLGKFDLLVCDEVHGAPGWLTDFAAVEITRNRLRKVLDLDKAPVMPNHARIEEWHQWGLEWAEKAIEARRIAVRESSKEAKKIDRLCQDLATLLEVSDPEEFAARGYREPWIVCPLENGEGYKFSPRWGSDFAEKYLFRGIEKVLLCSANATHETADYLGVPR